MRSQYDVVIIGSGFGGSVSALRLVEKGYRVAVLEAGRRFADDDFAKTSWHVRDYLFAPALGCTGIFRMTPLKNVLVLSGAGVGGGSLGYANTLYQPTMRLRRVPVTADELAPFYDQAKRMLGVTTFPTSPRRRGHARGCERHGRRRHVPSRRGRRLLRRGATTSIRTSAAPDRHAAAASSAAACMTGCRYNAKNTLAKNYLYLAERGGAEVFALTTVTQVRRAPGGYAVDTKPTGRRGRRPSPPNT